MVLPGATGQALGPWLSLRSPHFTLATDAGEAAGRQALYGLEQLRGVLSAPASPAQLEIFLFRSLQDFRAHHQHPDVVGFFYSATERRYLLAAEPRALLHEYVHLAQEGADYPLWAREGLADFYAGARFEPGQVLVGLPPAAYLAVLRRRPLMPLRELSRVDRLSPHYDDSSGRQLFYAQSWALAHMLTVSGRPLRADTEGLEEELARYVRRDSLAPLRFPSVPLDPKKFPVEALPKAEMSYRLAGLLLDQGRRAEGRRKLEELLAEEPDYLPALEMLGEIHLAEQQLDHAWERLEHAVRLGSRRAQTCYLAGLVRLHHGRDERGAEALLARAVELAPGHGDYVAALELARKKIEEREGAELRARALEARAPPPALPQALVSAPARMPRTRAGPRPQLQRLLGTLTRVDCLGPVARLEVLSDRGPVRLLIRGPYSLRLGGPRRLSCGPHMKPIRLAYRPLRDPYFQTLGDVRTLDY